MLVPGYESTAKRRLTAGMLLFAFLVLPVGGAASHYCFDGQEPPVSVHFDNFNGHDEHEEEEQHVDAEKRLLAENLVSKFFDSEQFLPATISCHERYLTSRGPLPVGALVIAGHTSPWSLTPPLRAPPELS